MATPTLVDVSMPRDVEWNRCTPDVVLRPVHGHAPEWGRAGAGLRVQVPDSRGRDGGSEALGRAREPHPQRTVAVVHQSQVMRR
jgi:hypothetical protein